MIHRKLHFGVTGCCTSDQKGAEPKANSCAVLKSKSLSRYYGVGMGSVKISCYTNTCVRINPGGPTDQKRFSPVSLVTADAKPVYIINTEEDSMPWHQIIDMQCALQIAGASNYKVWTIPGSDLHSFAYWTSPICDTSPCITSIKVRDRVIDFLDDHLKDPP